MPTVGGKKIKGVNTKMKYGYNSSAIAKYTAITGKSSKVKGALGTKPIPKVKFGHNSQVLNIKTNSNSRNSNLIKRATESYGEALVSGREGTRKGERKMKRLGRKFNRLSSRIKRRGADEAYRRAWTEEKGKYSQ
tara:strand:+ start:75 stop:479 length:405 start_codon:yes stop_codon:yes gene_type:complete